MDEGSSRRARFEAEAVPLMRAVFNLAFRLTGNVEDAKDVSQDAYVRAFRAFDSFVPGTNCKAWLFTVLYSVFVNRYHKARRAPQLVTVDDLDVRFAAVCESNPSQTAGWSDPEIEAALAALPADYRAAVLLVDLEELTYEEAATALGCPIGTVRSRLSRGRTQLYVALHEHARQSGYLKATGDR